MSLKYVEIISTQLKGVGNKKQDHFVLPVDIMLEKKIEVDVVFTTKKIDVDMIQQRFGTKINIVHTPTLFSLYKYLRKQKNSLLFINSRTPASFLSCFFGRKKIFMSHNSSLPKQRWRRTVLKYFLKKVDTIRVVNGHEQKELEKLGVPKSKTRVIPLVIDFDNYAKEPPVKEIVAFRKKYNLKKGDEIILFLSHIRTFKDPKTLLLAFKEVLKTKPATKLLIVGKDLLHEENHPSIREMAKELNLSPESIIETGQLPYTQVPVAMKVSDVAVNTSIHEGMCMAVYELASAKVPLCLSKIGSFTSRFENVNYHKVGDYKQLAKNLLHNLENKKDAKKMADKNQSQIKKLTAYSTIKKQIEELLDENSTY